MFVFTGVAQDGHIGFNEPGSSLVSRTRIKILSEDLSIVDKSVFGENCPKQALTVGIQTVMDAREVNLLKTNYSFFVVAMDDIYYQRLIKVNSE